MYFYVSWYQGDPFYPLYDQDCSLLVSISSVSRSWTIRRFPALPCRLLLDSGGYRFASAPDEALSPRELLQQQMSLLAGERVPTILCSRDFPILDGSASSNERDKSITQTIAFAYELKNLVAQRGLEDHTTLMAIVQGYDCDSLAYCAQELKTIGFPLYGIGSLAMIKQNDPIVERIEAVASIVGPESLHVFGVSIVQTVHALQDMGIHSINSSRSARAAAYNQILYSGPFRRYGIVEENAEGAGMRGRLPRSRRLEEPLPCACPVCARDPWQIMGVGKSSNIRSRALHNYYHLKRVFCEEHALPVVP